MRNVAQHKEHNKNDGPGARIKQMFHQGVEPRHGPNGTIEEQMNEHQGEQGNGDDSQHMHVQRAAHISMNKGVQRAGDAATRTEHSCDVMKKTRRQQRTLSWGVELQQYKNHHDAHHDQKCLMAGLGKHR